MLCLLNAEAQQPFKSLLPGMPLVHFDGIPFFHCPKTQLAVQVKHLPTSPLEITSNQLVLKQNMAGLFPEGDSNVAQRDCIILGTNI